jgi:hypothetical protein
MDPFGMPGWLLFQPPVGRGNPERLIREVGNYQNFLPPDIGIYPPLLLDFGRWREIKYFDVHLHLTGK